MAFEYESLVGHLNVVGGRAISVPPPGALCEVAPARASRGREADTFFALVTPAGESIAPGSFYERMAALAAERYFNSSGSVTSGLRELFTHVNQNLYDHNQKNEKKYSANMICGVLRGADLIVGRVGVSVAVLRMAGRTQTFPEDWNDQASLQTPPLGVLESPDIRLVQMRVSNGARIAFGDGHLAALALDSIDNALMSMDVATALVVMKELATLQLSAMIVEFVPPEAPSAPTVPIAQSTAILTGSTRQESAGTSTPPGKSAPQKPKKERRPGVLDVLWRHSKRATGQVLLRLAGMLGVTNKVIDHYFGPKTEGQRQWLTSPLGVGTVVFLPIAVVGLVIVLWLSGTEQSEFEICLQDLNTRHELVTSPEIVNSDRQRILDTWAYVQEKVDECAALRPNDPQVTAIRAEGQQITDRLERITRLEPTVIQSIPQATLTRIIGQGTNLFVLDDSGQIYQIFLNQNDLTQPQGAYRPIPEMREGAIVGGFEVGRIFDITFSDFSSSFSSLIAVADNGVLVECDTRFLQECRAERLLDNETWETPVAITTFVGNGQLYILDATAQNGQVWRYPRAGDSFSSGRSEYFSGTSKPPLRSPVDLQIDSNGNVYILLADGTVTKHYGGEQVSFALTSFPDTFASFFEAENANAAQSFFVDDTNTAQSVYIVAQGLRTIFETSLSGNFNAAYRTNDESLFDLLENATVLTDANRREILYAVSGNTVFALPLGD